MASSIDRPSLVNKTLAGYIASIGVPVDVEAGIIDRTSIAGMTPEAVRNLRGAIKGAAAVGLSKIVITAGKGGGHKSHGSGTEWDIKGFNADGSLWSNAQRIGVAKGARDAGADRFGVYEMSKGLGKGTLHIGQSGPGRPAAVWGAGGKTGGPGARRFTNPTEAAFAASVGTGSRSGVMPRKEAQAAIAQLGFTGASAVKQFQRAAGLKTDGIVGRDTTNAIRNALAQGTTYAAGQGMAPLPRSRPADSYPVSVPPAQFARQSPPAPITDTIAAPRTPVYATSLPPLAGTAKTYAKPATGPSTDAKYRGSTGNDTRLASPGFEAPQNASTAAALARYLSPPAADGSDIRTANSPLAGLPPERVAGPAPGPVSTLDNSVLSAVAAARAAPGPVSTLDTSGLSQAAAVAQQRPQMAAQADMPPLPRAAPQQSAPMPRAKPQVVAEAAPPPGGLYYAEPQQKPSQEPWQAVGALNPLPQLGKPQPGVSDREAQAKQDPWAATPKLMRPSFGLGLVGSILANAVLPGSGVLGRLAGREIGKRLPPTQLSPLTQKIGQGLDAIKAIQGGAPTQMGQYVAALNNAPGFQAYWSRSPNGSPMQTVVTPAGRTYQTYSIGPSLSPMDVTVYGDTSSNGMRGGSGGGSSFPTTNPSAGGVY